MSEQIREVQAPQLPVDITSGSTDDGRFLRSHDFDAGATWQAQTSVTGNESAPSTNTDGIDTRNASYLCCHLHSPSSFTSATATVWVYDETSTDWAVLYDQSGSAVSWSVGSSAMAVQGINVKGYDRADVKLTSVSGTSIEKNLKAA